MRDDIMGETYGPSGPGKRTDGVVKFIEEARYKVRDFIEEWWVSAVMLTLVAAASVLLVKASIHESKEKVAHEAAFMSECQQDKKHYECEAMWRAGEEHEHMIPVVIPMPSGR